MKPTPTIATCVALLATVLWSVSEAFAGLPVSPGETGFKEIFDNILVDYQNQFDQGCAVYSESSAMEPKISFADDDFIERRVGAGFGGPEETELRSGNSIFQTISPVVSTEECNNLISEARSIITEGLSENESPQYLTNSRLGEARVSEMPLAREWLRRSLRKTFFPLLESRFGVPASDFTLQDALVIGYGCLGEGGAQSQPIHRDSSLISLNVALSPRTDYERGGTFFEALPPENSIVSNDRGHVVCHAGGNSHAGQGITSGERWVLVLFCIAKDRPELARRCRMKGITKKDEGSLKEAKLIFEAGLSIAPNDHLLLTSLGGVYMAEGNEEAAMECLERAAQAYPHCQKANLALGKMLLQHGRPFAAIPRFDSVLDWMNDRDLREEAMPQLRAIGFDARVIGSQAALFCAEQAKERGFDFPWRQTTSTALDRLKIALAAAPGDTRILNMVARAEESLQSPGG